MNKEDLMSQDLLVSIHSALGRFAPDLQHHIKTLLRRGYVNTMPPNIGESIYPDYQVNMRADDASAILEVLRGIEKQHGYNYVFDDRQINFLICQWSKHVERLRKNPKSKIFEGIDRVPPPELELAFGRLKL